MWIYVCYASEPLHLPPYIAVIERMRCSPLSAFFMALLIKNAKGDYITLPDVKNVLNYYTCTQVANDLPCIDLHDTLENIEKAIIRYVYEQEGQNGSKAAERLNIGRSTLWRKLNRSDLS